jgi:hypothetical protein
MYETEAQIDELQALLDHSYAGAGEHLAAITTPQRRLTARQVVRMLQGTKHVAFATVNSSGEPYVAPLDGLFLWGRFYVGTDGRSLRSRHLAHNTAVSLTHFQGDEYSIVIHGQAVVIEKDDAEAARIDEVWQGIYGSSAFDLAEHIIFIRVEPRRMFTFAHHPESFPE